MQVYKWTTKYLYSFTQSKAIGDTILEPEITCLFNCTLKSCLERAFDHPPFCDVNNTSRSGVQCANERIFIFKATYAFIIFQRIRRSFCSFEKKNIYYHANIVWYCKYNSWKVWFVKHDRICKHVHSLWNCFNCFTRK